MANDNDAEIVPDVPDLPTVEDGAEDTTDWKAKAQESHEALKKAQGMAKRFQTKLTKLSEPKAPPAQQPAAQQGFDYAEKAYLKSSGIESQDFEFVKEVMDSTGKSLEQVLDAKYFQTELKERKDLRMAESATPAGSKRAGNTTRDQVEYWLAKGELPPNDQRELRMKVVNARIKAEGNKSQFTDQNVAGISFK